MSVYIGTLGNEDLYFQKKIVLKEENLKAFQGRVTEFLKAETSKRLAFGIFTTKLTKGEVCGKFKEAVLDFIKTKAKDKLVGTIWCVEVNGSAKGLGVVVADNGIKIWRDKRT